MKTFTIKFALLFFVSLLPFSIFSGDRPPAARIAYECAWAALYSAKKDALKARRKLSFESRKFQAELHRKASAHAYQAAYQAPSTPSIIQPAVYAKEYDSFLYRNPLKNHVTAWKNNNIPFLESTRYLAYCKYALLTERANEISEFTPPFDQIDIPEFIPLKTLK